MSTRTVIVEHRVRHEGTPKPQTREENLFIIKCPAGLSALRYWLQKRKYNCFVETMDANGKPMFGLLWDYHHGQFPSPKRGERGVVLILDRTLQKQAALIILNWMAAETAYSSQWKQAQRDLWQYGKA